MNAALSDLPNTRAPTPSDAELAKASSHAIAYLVARESEATIRLVAELEKRNPRSRFRRHRCSYLVPC